MCPLFGISVSILYPRQDMDGIGNDLWLGLIERWTELGSDMYRWNYRREGHFIPFYELAELERTIDGSL